MGGIWIQKEYGWPFVDEFHNLCIMNTGIIPGHIKWKKVPPPKPDSKLFRCYTLLVDLYFKYNRQGKMFFKTIITDSNYDFAHKIYNQGDPEVGFYKLYYLMILPTLSPGNEYHIRVADKTVSKKYSALAQEDRLEELRRCLNNGFIKKSGYQYWDDLVISIEPRPARERRLIQLADLLMGAVGFHWNGLHCLPDAKIGKIYLANYIARHLGRCNLCFRTSSTDRTFNIFRFTVPSHQK